MGMLRSRKLVKQVRARHGALSDSRMSGTSYGACILHVSPKAISAAAGAGETGDMISLDVDKRTIT